MLSAIQGALVAISTLGLFLLNRKQVVPFLAGAGVITLNFTLLAWMWRRILDKKTVALTFTIVVFKYAILGVVLYILVKELNLALIPLFAGLATLGLSFVMAALISHVTES